MTRERISNGILNPSQGRARGTIESFPSNQLTSSPLSMSIYGIARHGTRCDLSTLRVSDCVVLRRRWPCSLQLCPPQSTLFFLGSLLLSEPRFDSTSSLQKKARMINDSS